MTEQRPHLNDREFLISRYLDGDVNEQERSEVESALRSDPQFAELLEGYRRTDGLVRTLRQTTPPLDGDRFVRETRRRRAAGAGRRRLLVYRLVAPLTAAAMIALAFTTYTLVQQSAPDLAGPPPTVLVKFARPDATDAAGPRRGQATIKVERTPPPGYSPVAKSGGSYAVASAAVVPFSTLAAAMEAYPSF